MEGTGLNHRRLPILRPRSLMTNACDIRLIIKIIFLWALACYPAGAGKLVQVSCCGIAYALLPACLIFRSSTE